MGARRGKFRRLVDDFQATLDGLGASMPTEAVEALLSERITEVAAVLGITEATALRSHFADDWGADMARRAWAELADQDARQAQTPANWVPVELVARLIAALGQAQLFAAVNNGYSPDAPASTDECWPVESGEDDRHAAVLTAVRQQRSRHGRGLPTYDPATAAQATSGLGLALHGPALDATLDDGEVWVSGEVLAQTRDSLAGFAEQLRRRRWSPCPCGDDHGQDQITEDVLAAVVGDLAELYYLVDGVGDEDGGEGGALGGAGGVGDHATALSLLTEALGHELPELGRCGCGAGPATTYIGERGPLCDDCADQHTAAMTGWARLAPAPDPVEIPGPDGRAHRLQFRQLRSPAGISLTLAEITDQPGGHQFSVLGDHDADPGELAAAVHAEAAAEIGRAYLEPNDTGRGEWDVVADEIAGRFDIDPATGVDGPHAVVVDGHLLGWDELGAALARFEGWRFRLFLDDPSLDHR
ncbi:MAG: hypothetical protein L0I76_33700, partial [Pseudonocardia sp.]|nr:hypothetical protein [Pseudonocardia sp.]